jgi:hypothetical protein
MAGNRTKQKEKPMPTCLCVKEHRPPFFEGNRHHVIPQSWGGKTVDDNLVDICMNTHGTVHHGLNALTHIAWDTNKDGTLTDEQIAVALKPYPAYARGLIRRAIDGVGRKIPHVYTVPHPTSDS